MNTTIYNIYDNNKLSIRGYNVLKRAGITTLEELNNIDYDYLRSLKGCTHSVAIEILNLNNDKSFLENKNLINKEIQKIVEDNKIYNNKKVDLIIKLALDKASTVGEKLNCINKCKLILSKAI